VKNINQPHTFEVNMALVNSTISKAFKSNAKHFHGNITELQGIPKMQQKRILCFSSWIAKAA
jgi:hypothetical protein